MQKLLKENRGVTLIELVMVLAIASVIFAAIGSFLITNVQYFNKASDQAEIQRQTQRLIKDFTDLVIESSKITAIANRSDINVNLGSQGMNDISTVVFGLPDGAAYPSLVFEHTLSAEGEEKENQVAWEQAASTNDQSNAASYIKQFKLQPLPVGTSYANCKGVKVYIKAEKNRAALVIENHVYFRNAK